MTDVHNDFTGTPGARILETASGSGGTPLSVVNPPNTDAARYSTERVNPVTGGTVGKLDAAAGGSNFIETRLVRPNAVRGAQQVIVEFTGTAPEGTSVVTQMRGTGVQAANSTLATTAVMGVSTGGTTVGSTALSPAVPLSPSAPGTWLCIDEWVEQGTTATNGQYRRKIRTVVPDGNGGWRIDATLQDYTMPAGRSTGVQGTDVLNDYRVGDFTTTTTALPPMYVAWLRADDGATGLLSDPPMYAPAATEVADEVYVYRNGAWHGADFYVYRNGAWVMASTAPDRPTTPTGATVTGVTETGGTFGWAASTDTSGIAAYELTLNGTPLPDQTATTYTATGLTPGTLNTLVVVARDPFGNRSDPLTIQMQTVATGPVNPNPPSNLRMVSYVAGAPATDGSPTWDITYGWDAAVPTGVAVKNYRITWAQAAPNTTVPSGSYVTQVTGLTYTRTGVPAGYGTRLGVQTYDLDDRTSARIEFVSTAPAAPDVSAPLSQLDIDVQEARRYYPGGDLAPELADIEPFVRRTALGILELIPPEEGGPARFYWVPSGSTFTAPADRPGYVYKGRLFNPATSTSLDTALAAVGGRVQIECPELFTANNATGGLELSNVYASVVLGAEVNMDVWKGSSTPTTLYRTPADMSAGVNGVPMPRGGTWHYPTTAADLDTSNRHRQTIYAQGWTETARRKTGRGFQAWEGLRTRGEFAYEHFDWNGRNTAPDSNFRLVLSGIHMERVGALMHPDSSNKRPGGDGIQIFGGLKECVVIGATVDRTGYQAYFWQNDQGMGAAGSAGYPSLFVVKRANARWEDNTVQYGGATTETGPQQWAGTTFANNGTTVLVEDVYVNRPNRTRSQLVGGTWPTVTIGEHTNFVDATQVGLAYQPLGVS